MLWYMYMCIYIYTMGTLTTMGRGLAVKYYILVVLIIMVATCGGCWCQGWGCHDEERRALLEIKATINNITNGAALSDWGGVAAGGEEEDCCRWSHITCNHHTGRIVNIDLSELRADEDPGKFLMGPIFRNVDVCPGELLKDPVIKKEDIWYPNFTSFVQFRELEGLHLIGNGIGGIFPTGTVATIVHVARARNIKRLDFGSNSLEGPIPHCLCNMSSLTRLHLSDNHLHGNIPSCLGNLHDLEQLDLWGNEFQGSIPPSIFPNLTKLTAVRIGGDRLEGTLSFSVFANLSNLVEISMSSNHGLEIETESPSWVPSFQLQLLHISSCMVNRRSGGRLPGFISSTQQPRLGILQLADVSMTGTIPLWLLCNSSLWDLFLPKNMLHGTFHLPCGNASHNTLLIDLSHNRVHGSLPMDVGFSFPNLEVLNLARNELKGSIPLSLGQAPLFVLDLSDNHLSGKLPNTLTRNQTTLQYLKISNNQLEGEMLPADPFMPSLQLLYLHHNKFTGSIPPKISNSSLLKALDAGHNDMTCSLSQCLPTFPSMVALSLRKNRLQGHLPTHLCQIQHLHLLDLFGNNLSGKIPLCLNNISSWRLGGYEGAYVSHKWTFYANDVIHFTSKNLLNAYQGIPLAYMTGLDISSNQLDGPIPLEIGELRGLESLNLSNNYLQGSLPTSIGNMESLESLDLSHNNLSGTIPQELLQLHFLSTFIVAFNNLFGVIPYNPQFSTFPTSSYEGNPALCGSPLEKNCSPNMNTGQTPTVHQKEAEESSGLLDNTLLFLSCVALSFVLGFWGFIATLIFNKKWRIKYFRAVDRFLDYYLRRF